MRTLTVLAISLSVAVSAAASPLQVKLEVFPAVTLPGIPVTIRITYMNDRPSRPVEIPPAMMLTARSTGEQFPVPAGVSNHVVRTNLTEKVVGRASVVDEISPDGTFGVPTWFFSGALAQPGTYELQLYVGKLSECCAERPFPELVQKASAVSNTVKLTVAEPKGSDAAVWKALLGIAGSPEQWRANLLVQGEYDELVRDLLQRYPDSAYAGWLVTMAFRRDLEERATVMRQWLDKHPDDPYFERRMLDVAEAEAMLAHKYGQTKPDESKLHEAHARDDLAKLANAKSKAVRERVIDRLQWLDELHQ